MRSLILAIILLSAPLFAGCSGPAEEGSWSLSIYVESLDKTANQFEFKGNIVLEGNAAGVSIDRVKVVYLDKEEIVLTEATLASMSIDTPEKKVTTNLTERPHYIRLKIKSIDGRDPTFVGWRKWSEGEYVGQRIENKSKYTY